MTDGGPRGSTMLHRRGAQDSFGETIVIDDRSPVGYGQDAGATR